MDLCIIGKHRTYKNNLNPSYVLFVWHWTTCLLPSILLRQLRKWIFSCGGLFYSEKALRNVKNKQFWVMANSPTGVLDNNTKKLLRLQSWLPTKKQSVETVVYLILLNKINPSLSLTPCFNGPPHRHFLYLNLSSLPFLWLVLFLCLPSHWPFNHLSFVYAALSFLLNLLSHLYLFYPSSSFSFRST